MTRLEGLRVKTNRANQHIAELDKAVRVFLDSHPYEVFPNHNFQTRKMEWHLTRADEIPPQISAIAGDAIQNLRSALDHLAWQLVLTNGGIPRSVTGFPITASAQEHTSAKSRRRVEGMRQVAIDAIDALKPYQGGNETLWRLHCLNNRDKHRLLLSAVSALTEHHLLPSQREEIIGIYFGSYPDATEAPDLQGVFIKPTAALFPLEVGKVFLSIPDSEMENNFTFRFGLAFNEPGVVAGEPVLETVKQFADLVTEIINVFAPLL